jgi:hypothetical protein
MWENTLIEILVVGIEEKMVQHLFAKWGSFIIKGNFPHLDIQKLSHRG